MELNREQIIKALECCASDGCEFCPYSHMPTLANCVLFTMGNALALIKELTEEVADCKAIAEGYRKQFEDCAEDRAKLTAENERLAKQCGEIIVECDERDAERLKQVAELSKENERLREHNITLEQKLMLLGIDDVYIFKAKVKGE